MSKNTNDVEENSCATHGEKIWASKHTKRTLTVTGRKSTRLDANSDRKIQCDNPTHMLLDVNAVRRRIH